MLRRTLLNAILASTCLFAVPPERLDRLVAEYNRLRPDLVLIAGDLISGKLYSNRHYSPAEIAAPLARSSSMTR